MSYPCTMCGCCCNKIDVAVRAVEEAGIEIEKFPFKWDENGRCEMLVDNKCLVYDERPTLCNFEKMRVFFDVDDEEFLRLNKASCNKMIAENELDKKFLIA